MRLIKQIVLVTTAMLLLMSNTTKAKKWFPVGTPGFSASILYPDLAIDKNGTPYVAFIDTANSDKMSVMKYDGTNWVLVGSAGFTLTSPIILSIAIDKNGVPYVAYCDDWDYKIVVMKFDGTNWNMVGSPGLSADLWGINLGLRIPLAIDNNGTPYVAGGADIPFVGLRATVVKYDGTNWVVVGNAGFSDSTIGVTSIAIDNNGTPYVAYEDEKYWDRATVMKYNGSTWTALGGPGFTVREAYIPVINIDPNNVPYLSYNDRNKSYKGTVQKYDGTNWVTVGNAGFTHGAGDYITSAIDGNGTIYAIYRNEFTGLAEAMTYDGSAWVYAGKKGFSDGTANFYAMAIDKDNAVYVAYQDYAHGARTTVMKYYCPPQKPAICAALTDTVTGSNIIAWDGSAIEFADSYRIYREDMGSYKHIGSVPGTAATFTDPTANPATQSYNYKLTLLDSCGKETDIDSVLMHKTMRLVFNYLIGDKASITWNSYVGLSNPVYSVQRSNNGGAFTTIASFGITGSDTTYIDINPPTGSNRYRMDIATAGPCNKITSNTVTSWHTGIEKLTGSRIHLAPNPADKLLNITATEPMLKIEVFGLSGNKLLAQNGNGTKAAAIDISTLPAGMYLLRVNEVHHTTFIKR